MRLACLRAPRAEANVPLFAVVVLGQLLTVGVIWSMVLAPNQFAVAFLTNLWLFLVYGVGYVTWSFFRSRGRIRSDTGIGLVVAALGLASRIVCETCLFAFFAFGGWNYTGLSLLEVRPDERLAFIAWVLRNGGLLAFVLGLAFTGRSVWQDMWDTERASPRVPGRWVFSRVRRRSREFPL